MVASRFTKVKWLAWDRPDSDMRTLNPVTYAFSTIQHTVCNFQSAAHSVWFPVWHTVCDFQFNTQCVISSVVYSVQFPQCSMQCAVSSVACSVQVPQRTHSIPYSNGASTFTSPRHRQWDFSRPFPVKWCNCTSLQLISLPPSASPSAQCISSSSTVCQYAQRLMVCHPPARTQHYSKLIYP